MEDVYYNPSNPRSFGGIKRLKERYKKKRKGVRKWLTFQDTYTLHKPVRKSFPRRRVLVHGIDDQWQKWLQTTQPTSGGAVTADKNCCANCVEPSRPQQWGPDLPFFGHAGHADPLDGWRCCSQKRVMSRPIQVRQH